MAYRNHHFDSCCILTILIPEMMPRAVCCKKSFQIQREFQLIISEIIDHHNRGWPRNPHFNISYQFIC